MMVVGVTWGSRGASVQLGSPTNIQSSCQTIQNSDSCTPAPQIAAALPALEALPRLSRLVLHHNRIATLPALDRLLRLPRLRALSISGSPVNGLSLLRPYVAHRLTQLVSFNGRPVGAGEAEAAGRMFGPVDAELAHGLVSSHEMRQLRAHAFRWFCLRGPSS
jgi:hypothetical protein